jgi:hypothetical protein
MIVSTRALIMLTDKLRQRRTQLRTRWRHLKVGQQALLVLAHLRKGETYVDLAIELKNSALSCGKVERCTERTNEAPAVHTVGVTRSSPARRRGSG